ncbi:hypothetical protein KI387_001058, partial [Taxus chinensis]
MRLHLATIGLHLKPESCPLAIHYKVIYRLGNTMYPAVKHGISKGSNVVSHTNIESHKIELELISWSQIKVPKEWTLSKRFIEKDQPRVENNTVVNESKSNVTLSFRSKKLASKMFRSSSFRSNSSYFSTAEPLRKSMKEYTYIYSQNNLIHDPNTDYLWCKDCEQIIKQKYVPSNGPTIRMASKETNIPVYSLPSLESSEILSPDENQKAIFWYQRTVDRHVDPSESSKMLNWTNNFVKTVHDRLQSQESILAEMEKTLKAIELHQKGDLTSALRLLNSKVDDVSSHIKKVDKSLENVSKNASVCPDIPRIVSREVIDVVQPLVSQSEDTKKDIASKIGTTPKLVQNSLHQLHESTIELTQKVDQVQEHVKPIPEIVPHIEQILENTKKPEEIELDWSHKVSWIDVANPSRSSECHKIVLLQNSSLFISDVKSIDKGSISMAKLLPEEVESMVLMDETSKASTSEPLHHTARTQTLQRNWYKLDCSTPEQIKELIHGIIGWENSQLLLYRKDPRVIIEVIVNGFVGIVKEWWDVNPHHYEILDGGYASLTVALIQEFLGTVDNDKLRNTTLFLKARLCDMSRIKEYQCYMQKLYYNSGNINDPTMKLKYVESFPAYFATEYKKAMHGRPTTELGFGAINQIIDETNARLCQEKQDRKEVAKAQKALGTKLYQLIDNDSFGCRPTHNCPPWDTAKKTYLSQKVRELERKYSIHVRAENEAHERKEEEEEKQRWSHQQKNSEATPTSSRPPIQGIIRQRQTPYRGRGCGRGRCSPPRRSFPFLFPKEDPENEFQVINSNSDVVIPTLESRRIWRRNRIEFLQKVIAKATNEYKRLIEEETREKKEAQTDDHFLEEAYQQILHQEAEELIPTEEVNTEKDEKGNDIIPKFRAHHKGMIPAERKECHEEIKKLIQGGFIQESNSSWACASFYVNTKSEQVCQNKKLVVDCNPLNKFIKDVQHPIPTKDDLLSRIKGSKVYNKFDLKSGFCKIFLKLEDTYKTIFVVPRGQYEWKVLPFGLKTALSIFQKMMENIFGELVEFLIVYIDDIIIFSKSPKEHIEHLQKFYEVVYQNGLCLSPSKMEIFKDEMDFLGITVKDGCIEMLSHIVSKIQEFPDQIIEKVQLQRFFGCINYVAGFYKDIAADIILLNKRLRKNAPSWSPKRTQAVKRIKEQVQKLPVMSLSRQGLKIIETDASEDYWGVVLKEKISNGKEKICRYASGSFQGSEVKYHLAHKEISSTKKSIKAFLFFIQNEHFILRSYLKDLKTRLNNGDLANKTTFNRLQRWGMWFDNFIFEIEHIKDDIFDVNAFGAKADGETDDSKAFLAAWNAACSSTRPSNVFVPQQKFLVNPVTFVGPCKNDNITMQITGELIASTNNDLWSGKNKNYWLQFTDVKGLTIEGGGILDGQGASWWPKINENQTNQNGPTSLRFTGTVNTIVRNITSINSKQFHIDFNSCTNVEVEGVTIQAPGDSPNTDGIHVGQSSNVKIKGVIVGTGDDCISMGSDSFNVTIEDVKCGPGHGIRIVKSLFASLYYISKRFGNEGFILQFTIKFQLDMDSAS